MEETTPTAPRGFEESRYLSYLVRLWREAPGAEWRCQVHNVGSGQERRFVGLAGLFSYLEDQATAPSKYSGPRLDRVEVAEDWPNGDGNPLRS